MAQLGEAIRQSRHLDEHLLSASTYRREMAKKGTELMGSHPEGGVPLSMCLQHAQKLAATVQGIRQHLVSDLEAVSDSRVVLWPSWYPFHHSVYAVGQASRKQAPCERREA